MMLCRYFAKSQVCILYQNFEIFDLSYKSNDKNITSKNGFKKKSYLDFQCTSDLYQTLQLKVLFVAIGGKVVRFFVNYGGYMQD